MPSAGLSKLTTSDLVLKKLLEAAKRPMTAAEVVAQRRSWVIGETMLSHPSMTREEAERLVLAAEVQVYGS